MFIRKIFHSKDFIRQFEKIPLSLQQVASKKQDIFIKNSFHPSLRLHGLKGRLLGLFSISINLDYRIIFKRKDSGDVIFVSIGKHDIYDHL